MVEFEVSFREGVWAHSGAKTIDDILEDVRTVLLYEQGVIDLHGRDDTHYSVRVIRETEAEPDEPPRYAPDDGPPTWQELMSNGGDLPARLNPGEQYAD